MVKILSQAGQSLADMYQVEGSIAGIEQLRTDELPIVHEVGATVFSERFRTTYRRVSTGAILQNTDFDLAITNFPEGISRILGVTAFSDDAARITNCTCSVNDPIGGGGQDFPIWVWSGTTTPPRVRLEDGGTVTTYDLLMPDAGSAIAAGAPTFVTVDTQGSRPIRDIYVRGRTTAFGAGNVTIIGLVHFAFSFTGGVSARGARVPSW